MARKPAKPNKAKRNAQKIPVMPAKGETKQNMVLALLRRQDGASIAEIVEATGWQPHSVRGFFAGALKKRLGFDVVSEKGEDGVRRYYVAAIAS